MYYQKSCFVPDHRYVDALHFLMASDHPDHLKFLDILKFHYHSDEMTTTSDAIANHMNYLRGNLIYGKLGKFFGTFLELKSCLPRWSRNNKPKWFCSVSIGIPPDKDVGRNHFEYRLDPELAKALIKLNLV